MLRIGASTDDVCAGCGSRGQVAWISGEVALGVGRGEMQPRVVAFGDLGLRQPPRTAALLDLYLCAGCLAAAQRLAEGRAARDA